jgi:hypothetical protein
MNWGRGLGAVALLWAFWFALIFKLMLAVYFLILVLAVAFSIFVFIIAGRIDDC